MIIAILAFYLGILLVQQCTSLLGAWTLWGLGLSLCFAVYRRYYILIGFIFGIIWASLWAYFYLDSVLEPQFQGKELLIQGQIVGLPVINAQRVRFDFEVKNTQVPLPKKIRLNWYYPPKEQAFYAGQVWRFWVKLKAPHGTLNPGGFDYERWLFSQHIGATGYIRQADQAELLAQRFTIGWLRQSLAERLSAYGLSENSLAIIKALTLGDKSDISREQWQVLLKTGTNHLMAISGLHIGFVAGLCFFWVRWFYLKLALMRYTAPQVATVFAILAAFIYAALAGFSVPTQRALIMTCLFGLSVILRRPRQVFSVLLLALGLILLWSPLSVLSSGLYLSFLAVAMIIFMLSSRLENGHKVYTAIKLQGLIGLSLLPILLFYFQSVSLVAPLANMIAVPVVSFLVVPLSLLAVLNLLIFPDFSGFLLRLVDSIVQYLGEILAFLAQLPFANIVTSKPDSVTMLVAMLGIILILAPKGVPHRYLGLLLIAPLFLNKVPRPLPNEFWMTVLDVGQGLSVVIETTEHTLVFDTGAKFSESFNMGASVLMPFLNSRTLKKIDTLIISHADNDHIGGAESLLASIKVADIKTSVPDKLPGYQTTLCQAGEQWFWNQVHFEMLSPPKELFKSENDNSCVLKISSEYGSVLLTGDIEKNAEQDLVESGLDITADILIAPHHGSKTSSSPLFLQTVKAKSVIIPADAPNRFGFPHAEVIARYQALGINFEVTGKQGAIQIEFNQAGLVKKSYRERARRYWHQY